MSKEILTAKLYRDFAHVIYRENDATISKNISLGDLRALFTEYQFESPLFPLWTISYKEGNTRIGILTCRDTNIMHLNMGTEREDLDLHLPYVYFKWIINKDNGYYRVAETKIYTSYGAPHPDTKLYVPAIPNVYEDGNICWGRNSNEIHRAYPDTDLTFLKQLENIFFIGIHNYDLVSSEAVNRGNGVKYTTESEWKNSSIIKQSRAGIRMSEFIKNNL